MNDIAAQPHVCDLPAEARSTQLTSEDLAWCNLLNSQAWAQFPEPNAGAYRRRHVLSALMKRLNAHSWVWCYSLVGVNELVPTTLATDHARVGTLREAVVFARHCQLGGTELPGENPTLCNLIFQGRHFTRTVRGMYPTWSRHQQEIQTEFADELGVDDIVYSMRPIEFHDQQWRFVGVGFGRRTGDPEFDPYQVRLVHVALATCSCVYEPPARALSPLIARLLDRSSRPLIAVILAGFDAKKAIAEFASQAMMRPQSLAKYLRTLRARTGKELLEQDPVVEPAKEPDPGA